MKHPPAKPSSASTPTHSSGSPDQDKKSKASSPAAQQSAASAAQSAKSVSASAEENDSWSVLGFLISRKIDFVAFAAFLLSIGALGFQISAYLKGAELKLLPPDQVFMRKDTSYSDKIPRALFGASLIYANSGEKGYSAIVRRELMYVTIGGKDFEQGWDEFVTYDGFNPKKNEPVKPFSIDGGDSKSHQTAFVPWPKRCGAAVQGACDVLENHVHWDDFINELKRLVQAGQHEFGLKFAADLMRGEKVTSSCKIEIDIPTIGAIEQLGGYNPTCFESK
jgi:hypothetical protein